MLELARFRVEGLLGEGAEVQVFAATDTLSGDAVVLKRPHPALVQRGQHHEVERHMRRAQSLRDGFGVTLRHVVEVIGLATADGQVSPFGDSLGQVVQRRSPTGSRHDSYVVAVARRAKGLPLAGSPSDAIKGMPIGLPQNLFARHPVVAHSSRGAFSIAKDLMDTVEVFHGAGYLLLDLRPQNVFFGPRTAEVTIIDLGGVVEPREATGRAPQLDFHDALVEVIKWYLPAGEPPARAGEYAGPYGMDSVPDFTRDIEAVLDAYSELAPGRLRDTATSVLHTTRRRGYGSLATARRDLDRLLRLMAEGYAELAGSQTALDAWTEAAGWLQDPAWGKFLFDAEADLGPYRPA